ncbi:MAG: hypothetical protein ACLUDQ_02115 [Bilophila wadsworthia]
MKGFRLDRPADRWCLGCGLVLVLSLLLSDTVLRAYVALTDAHPFAAGFCKFALLATFGESLAQRMLVGRYLPPRFGLVPRALAWGVLGICITLAFMIFPLAYRWPCPGSAWIGPRVRWPVRSARRNCSRRLPSVCA